MSRRGVAWVSAVGVVFFALAAVHVHNFVRLDLGGWRADAEPLLERARAISERARPEYQDLALATLPPNPHNGPFYRFDDRLHEAEIIEQPAAVSEADQAVLLALDFDQAGDPGLIAADAGSAPRVENGMLRALGYQGEERLTSTGSIAIPPQQIGDILLRARANAQTWMMLGMSGHGGPAGRDRIADYTLSINLSGDGQFHTYVINGRNVPRNRFGTVGQIVVRPTDGSAAEVEIDFLHFLSKRASYLGTGQGALYETLGGEMRKALYMVPERALEWTIELPERASILEFGNGVLLDGLPVSFEVRLETIEGRSVLLHERTVDAASGWQDFRYDLTRWAGQRIGLQLEVSGDRRNVAFWSTPWLHSAPTERFNVIILLEDTLRADYLSTYGYELETSPNKTSLMKARGVQFDWALSQATRTRPSVPTLMTSLYPTATGVWHYSDSLSERYLTLAEVLRAQGFATAAFLQNGNAGPYAGLHQGFSDVYDEQIMGTATEEMVGERVLSWIERHRARNFFVYLHALDPHGPWEPPPPFDAWYRALAGDNAPAEWKRGTRDITDASMEGPRRRYIGEIQHNDALLPRLLEKLDELRLTESTLLILVSDHGQRMGEHGRIGHRPPGLMPVLHVPFMLVYPKRFKEPKRIDDPVQLIDVMPTVLALAGVDATDLLMQGDSLVGLIEGRDPERWRDRVVVSEEPSVMLKHRPCRCASMIRRDWHVISSTHFWLGRAGRWLPRLWPFVNTRVYGFRDDPDEESAQLSVVPDLYVRWLAADLVSELQEANLSAWRKLTAGESVDLKQDPATVEHLRGLGYVN